MSEAVFIDKFLIRLALAVFAALIGLIIIGERRLDVYIAVFILVYFIFLALYSPLPKEVEGKISLLSKILLMIFIIIVTFRILEILAPTIITSILGL